VPWEGNADQDEAQESERRINVIRVGHFFDDERMRRGWGVDAELKDSVKVLW
jgi:hypothetical protein